MDPLEKPSHALRAAALSLMPGLGHLYIGEKRGGPLLAAGLLLIQAPSTTFRPWAAARRGISASVLSTL